ncbi:hypothetical protein DMENIID0001_070560 [Sergentomyia squamirostris]
MYRESAKKRKIRHYYHVSNAVAIAGRCKNIISWLVIRLGHCKVKDKRLDEPRVKEITRDSSRLKPAILQSGNSPERVASIAFVPTFVSAISTAALS